MKRLAHFAFLILTAGTALTAGAASKTPSFDEADRNKDNVISVDEAAKVPGLDFNAADKDQDGTLTREEYDVYMASKATSKKSAKPQ